jgi:hypothetical protein
MAGRGRKLAVEGPQAASALFTDTLVELETDGAAGLLEALLATGSKLQDSVLEVIRASRSAQATLAAAKPHCATRGDQVQVLTTIALTGIDDPGVAASLWREGIHPLSVRLEAAVETGTLPQLEPVGEPNGPMGRAAAVVRLDRTLAIPVQFRLDPEVLLIWKSAPCPLQNLPEGLVTTTSVVLNNAKALELIPAGLETGSDLNLDDCSNLVALGDGLRVGRDLCLKGCRSLRSLPKGLVVGRVINLQGCVAWDGEFPEDAQVGGHIFVDAAAAPMTLDAYRKFRLLAEARTVGGRTEWDAILASGAGVWNAVDALLGREDPVGLATWALETVRKEPFEVMVAIQAIIHGRRHLGPYVAALRAAGIHPLSLATTAGPKKAERIMGAIGAHDFLDTHGKWDDARLKKGITFDGRMSPVEIFGWPKGKNNPFLGDDLLPLIVGGKATLGTLEGEPHRCPPLWVADRLWVFEDKGTAWLDLPPGTRCARIGSLRIQADQRAQGARYGQDDMTWAEFEAWRPTQGWLPAP